MLNCLPCPSLVKLSSAPTQDDPTQESYNVPDRVNAFVAAANDQAQHYTTNNIMMTFGDDFQYENAHQNFKNIDKLIKYVNQVSCCRIDLTLSREKPIITVHLFCRKKSVVRCRKM